MVRVELNIDEQTLKQAENFARKKGATVQAVLEHQIKGMAQRETSGLDNSHEDSLTGLFSDAPEVMDQVVEDAMRDRATRYERIVDV